MSSPRYLLISENDSLAQEMVSAAVGADAQVQLARDAAEAVELLDRAQPDAVLWEMDASDEDSVIECRRLRRHSPVPIVMLVSRFAKDQIVRGYRLGADAHIPIPCDKREFSARVAAVMRRSIATA